MGGSWRRNNYDQRNAFDSRASRNNDNRWTNSTGNRGFAEGFRLGSPSDGRAGQERNNPNYIPILNRAYRDPRGPFPRSYIPPRSLFQDRFQPYRHPQKRPLDDDIFLSKSKRFKEFLVRSINQTLSQLYQWYPDDDPNDDKMDWQHEPELAIPLPKEYVVNIPPPKTPTATNDTNFGEPFIKRRTASEGGGGEGFEKRMGGSFGASGTPRNCMFSTPRYQSPTVEMEVER